jgi:mannose-6-phosphate isomerase-like protein (cupin superfamily)
MRKLTLTDCKARGDGPVFAGIGPSALVERGGLSRYPPGERSHPEQGRHVHDTPELFWIIQGSGHLDVDGTAHPFESGDILWIDPGEDHHVVSGGDLPLVSVWMRLEG